MVVAARKIQKITRKWSGRMALVLVTGLFSAQPATAQDKAPLTPHQQLARDIYRDVIAFRTARGQEQVPAMVSYLVDRFKKAGFSDDDIQVTDYDSEGDDIAVNIARQLLVRRQWCLVLGCRRLRRE